ncbi:MAG: hypothetical protein H7039_04925 [Bryobacteraceae bacterium]|nr:hypothetical protein [Bryobacteraceae bacterium]
MRHGLRTALCCALSVLTVAAATVHEYDSCLPLILDGDGWKTTITLVNLDSAPSNFQLSFLGETGFRELWPVTITAPGAAIIGQSVTGVLDAGASLQIETSGASQSLIRGYAHLAILSGSPLGGSAVLTRTVDGKVQTSTAIPLSPESEQKSRLQWTASDTEVTELVMVSDTMSATVDLAFRDMQGKVLARDTITFGEKSLQVIPVSRFPELANGRGTVEWSVSFPGADIYEDLTFSAVALKRNTSGLVTALPPMTLPKEQSRKSQH